MNSSSIRRAGDDVQREVRLVAIDPPLESDPRLQVALLDERLLDALDAIANLEEVVVSHPP